jgi:Mor family transcriptional regulator
MLYSLLVKSSKLKEVDVIFIRKTNMKVTELMKKYSVCERTIYDVKRNLSWTHVKM